MLCLVDVNVWLALLLKEHGHHAETGAWFDSLQPGEAGLCRIVQLALIRLLGNRTIMGTGALSASAAWQEIAGLLEDERVELIPEPKGIDAILPTLLRYPVPAINLISDAYLAAFAICADRILVSQDRGFEQFKGLRLRFLQTKTAPYRER